MPFMFDTTEDINSLEVYIVDTCSGDETDLSADLELEFIKEDPGAVVEEEILTTSQQLRIEFYEFKTDNYIIQEFKINDTGELDHIDFEWLFNNTAQTITVSLILGTNPNILPVSVKTITDNAVTSKELSLDYSTDAITVTAGETYLLRFSSDAPCEAGIGVNSTKIYPDGRFGERNYVAVFKEYFTFPINGDYVSGDNLLATFTNIASDECNGTILHPNNPSTYSVRYTATSDQVVRIRTDNIGFTITIPPLAAAVVHF